MVIQLKLTIRGAPIHIQPKPLSGSFEIMDPSSRFFAVRRSWDPWGRHASPEMDKIRSPSRDKVCFVRSEAWSDAWAGRRERDGRGWRKAGRGAKVAARVLHAARCHSVGGCQYSSCSSPSALNAFLSIGRPSLYCRRLALKTQCHRLSHV